MCGIAGIVGTDAAWFESALARMTRAQQHRGPEIKAWSGLPLGRMRLMPYCPGWMLWISPQWMA